MVKDDRIALRIPTIITRALAAASQRELCNPSEYARRAIVERLRQDGILPTVKRRSSEQNAA